MDLVKARTYDRSMREMPIATRGVKRRMADLMSLLADCIDEACQEGDSCLAISRRTGVNHSTLSLIRKRQYESVLSFEAVLVLCEEFDIPVRIGNEG